MDAPLVWRVRIDEDYPPSRAEVNETIVDESPLGTPIKGSCALLLLVLKARARLQCTMDFPRHMLVGADQGGANLWSYGQ